jgi:hypothetical protein
MRWDGEEGLQCVGMGRKVEAVSMEEGSGENQMRRRDERTVV